MIANLLKSDRAAEMSVAIVRAFIRMREFLNSQKEFTRELSEMKSFLLKQSNQASREFQRVWAGIEKMSNPRISGQKIGFKLD